MAGENEPAKQLLPYLQRADELQNHDLLVAYYCRLYAMELGLKIPQKERTKMTNSLLVSLMNQLEKDKKSVKLGPDDHLHLEGFALNVFSKADKQDRAGRADISTAKTFYAATIFFDILKQFGELAPDLAQKLKYSAWKAADIRKALKEGKKPVPGPPGGENELSRSSSFAGDTYDSEPKQGRNDINPGFESGPSPQSHDDLQRQTSGTMAPSPYHQIHDELQRHSSVIMGPSHPQFRDELQSQPSANIAPSTPPFPTDDSHNPTADYPSHDYHSPHPTSRSDGSTHSQAYNQHSYPQEHQTQPHAPQSYPSQEIPPNFTYPNFQSYPSFSESSLPAAPAHFPSYYQGAGVSYSHQSAPSATSYPQPSQSAPSLYHSNSGNGIESDAVPPSARPYEYDCNYQPPAHKIAEAHKAARFAVGALAFDDVSVAVEHLKKSLELLTNPSSGN